MPLIISIAIPNIAEITLHINAITGHNSFIMKIKRIITPITIIAVEILDQILLNLLSSIDLLASSITAAI